MLNHSMLVSADNWIRVRQLIFSICPTFEALFAWKCGLLHASSTLYNLQASSALMQTVTSVGHQIST